MDDPADDAILLHLAKLLNQHGRSWTKNREVGEIVGEFFSVPIKIL